MLVLVQTCEFTGVSSCVCVRVCVCVCVCVDTYVGPGEYHFICECFFMTLKSLHFGLVKMLDDMHAMQYVRVTHADTHANTDTQRDVQSRIRPRCGSD